VVELLFHPEADAEYSAGVRWYDDRSPHAAFRFETEVDHVLELICADPAMFPLYDEVHRFALVRRFPYSVVYRFLSGQLYVIAVAHSSRRPGYWQDRV